MAWAKGQNCGYAICVNVVNAIGSHTVVTLAGNQNSGEEPAPAGPQTSNSCRKGAGFPGPFNGLMDYSAIALVLGLVAGRRRIGLLFRLLRPERRSVLSAEPLEGMPGA